MIENNYTDTSCQKARISWFYLFLATAGTWDSNGMLNLLYPLHGSIIDQSIQSLGRQYTASISDKGMGETILQRAWPGLTQVSYPTSTKDHQCLPMALSVWLQVCTDTGAVHMGT